MHPGNLGRVKNKNLRNEATPYGFHITAPGFISEEDATIWMEDLMDLVRKGRRERFGLLVDIRGQLANPPGATAIIKDVMRWLRAEGCERSAVVLDNSMALLQIQRLARESGVYEYERYINARANPGWESTAMDWITRGTDPDAEPSRSRLPDWLATERDTSK